MLTLKILLRVSTYFQYLLLQVVTGHILGCHWSVTQPIFQIVQKYISMSKYKYFAWKYIDEIFGSDEGQPRRSVLFLSPAKKLFLSLNKVTVVSSED